MSDALRCPDCGATNPPGAAWCGQCLRRFDVVSEGPASPPPDEPVPRLAPVPQVQPGVRRAGDAVVWTCPACETENTMDVLDCTVCGTALARLFAEPEETGVQRSRGTVLGLTAILPGAGHIALGMTAAGLGRAVLYLWTLLVGVFLVLRDVRRNAGMVQGLGALFILAAIAVWALSFVEATRASRGDRTLIVRGRALTWATAGLTFLLFLGLALIVRSR